MLASELWKAKFDERNIINIIVGVCGKYENINYIMIVTQDLVYSSIPRLHLGREIVSLVIMES